MISDRPANIMTAKDHILQIIILIPDNTSFQLLSHTNIQCSISIWSVLFILRTVYELTVLFENSRANPKQSLVFIAIVFRNLRVLQISFLDLWIIVPIACLTLSR